MSIINVLLLSAYQDENSIRTSLTESSIKIPKGALFGNKIKKIVISSLLYL